MPQRLHLDQRVDLLVDLYGEDSSGRVRAIIYMHPEDAPYAAHLAAIMGVPAQLESGAGSGQATGPAVAAPGWRPASGST